MNLEEARVMALGVMAANLPLEWKFRWDNAVQRLGSCNYRDKTITLSRPMTKASTAEQVMDTIRHEVAHALAGPTAGHGRAWKIIALRLGANPTAATTDAPNLRAEAAPWVGTCPADHVSTYRFWRKPRNNRSCYKCDPTKYNPAHVITYRKVDTLANVR